MKQIALALVFSLCAAVAGAHVSLVPAQAEAGAPYRGVLTVGHGCGDAATTSVEVQLPGGTRVFDVKDKAAVPVEFTAPQSTGPLWIKAVQRCGSGHVEWTQVPVQGTSTEGLKNPAMLVQVMSPAQAQASRTSPSIENAWVRASVAGQQSTGAFMRITANEPTRLVGASSPVAGITEVHEMKMEGDVMRMRPAGEIALQKGQALELKPGGYHLMLQDLKKPLAAGSEVPVTLVFRNAQGAESRVELRLPVALQAPAQHKH